MRFSVHLSGLVAACVAVCAAPAWAGGHKYVFPEQARALQGGRTVEVLVAQEELKSNINVSNVVVATGGGLLGALVDAKINSDRTKRAEAEIQPLRAALTGFDADALARDATTAWLAGSPWFTAASTTFSRDSSVVGKSTALDASATPQMAIAEYIYDTAPDFSTIRVSLTVSVADKTLAPGKKPESRLTPNALVYAQTVTSVISLPSPSKDGAENAVRWTADNAKLARKALAQGFADVGLLMPRALAISEDDVKTMGGKDKKFLVLAGYRGRVQEEAPDGTLLFDGVLVHVHTLAE